MDRFFRRGRTVGSDSKYFTATSRGEIGELRKELASTNESRMKDAVKRVVALVTQGTDVSSLFPDVINTLRSENLEIKKASYLLIQNGARANPELAILAVNSFLSDARNPNPLLRALAIRTMGTIKVERITEHLCSPLKRALVDEDPYVRKTAAICVAKLWDISPSMAKDQGFLDLLVDMLADGVPQVVANAVAALSEISTASGRPTYDLTPARLQKLLAALNECSEWGQTFILDALSTYEPADDHEAENIAERVSPRLAHRNPAVVLGAVKIILRMMDRMPRDKANTLGGKLGGPLVTLAQSSRHEVQYVALRNIAIIVQKRPEVLAGSLRVFVCKFDDPIYVKMEKLEILTRLASESNIDEVLAELKGYAQEVDVEYVRRAVRTIGRCAIKLDAAAERCIKVLLQLIKTKVSYVVQEAVVVVRDIFRRYPNRYESVISVLCEALESLDEPDAKSALVWIVGEYARRIENADELLESFLDGFTDETANVQLALLTAIVKLYLVRPEDGDDLVKRVLQLATEESDNPDLRDRGFVYWRLLARKPEAARAVVLAEKPIIEDDTSAVPADKLDEYISQLSTLSAVFHKPPEAFVRRTRRAGDADSDSDSSSESSSSEEEEEGEEEEEDGDLLDMPAPAAPATTSDVGAAASGGGRRTMPSGGAGSSSDEPDLFGGGGGGGGSVSSGSAAAAVPATSHPILGAKDHLQVRGKLVGRGGEIQLELAFDNSGSAPVDSVALRVNVNSFGLTPAVASLSFSTGGVPPGSSGAADPVLMRIDPTKLRPGDASPVVDVAIRDNTTKTAVIFKVSLEYEQSFAPSGRLERADWLAQWKEIGADGETRGGAKDVPNATPDAVKEHFEANSVFHVATRSDDASGETRHYFSAAGCGVGDAAGPAKAMLLIEAKFRKGFPAVGIAVRTKQPAVARFALEGLVRLVRSTGSAPAAAHTGGDDDLFA